MTDEPADADDSTDPLLAVLVRMANDLGLDAGITLFVGGSVVSGTLVGGRRWSDALVAQFIEGSGDATSVLGSFFEKQLHEVYPDPAFLSLARAEGADPPFADRPIGYIHLLGARVFDTSGALPRIGTAWRGRLSRVDAWSMGRLEFDADSES